MKVGFLKKVVPMLCLSLSVMCFSGCGNQVKTQSVPTQSLIVSGGGSSVSISLNDNADDNYAIEKDGDGFAIAVKSGKVNGRIISEIEYNNLMATYYADDSYNTISVQGGEGFGYVSVSKSESESVIDDVDDGVVDDEASDDQDEAAVSVDSSDETGDVVSDSDPVSKTVEDGITNHVFCAKASGGVYVALSSVAGEDALYQAEEVLVFEVAGSDVKSDVVGSSAIKMVEDESAE